MDEGINILDLVNDYQGSGPLQSFPVKPHIQVKDKPHIQVEKRKRCSICFSSNHDHWSCEHHKRAQIHLRDYNRQSVSRNDILLPITIRKSIISFLWRCKSIVLFLGVIYLLFLGVNYILGPSLTMDIVIYGGTLIVFHLVVCFLEDWLYDWSDGPLVLASYLFTGLIFFCGWLLEQLHYSSSITEGVVWIIYVTVFPIIGICILFLAMALLFKLIATLLEFLSVYLFFTAGVILVFWFFVPFEVLEQLWK
jgi:hypothetical protein|tara:strand:- start:916 stop:1668 length:753 start_codon:yes stop_codon:yes gene_type:complete